MCQKESHHQNQNSFIKKLQRKVMIQQSTSQNINNINKTAKTAGMIRNIIAAVANTNTLATHLATLEITATLKRINLRSMSYLLIMLIIGRGI